MKLTGFIFLLLFPALAISQPFVDIISLRFQHFPPVPYRNTERSKVTLNQYTGNVNLPIPLKNKDVLITGGTYDQLNFSNSEQRASLYAVNLQLGYLKHWKGRDSSRLRTMVVMLPKLSSNQLLLSKDAFQLGGIVLFTYVKRANLKYKAGLYYNREFFGNFFMPLLGLEWKPSDRLNVFGVLPGNMNIEYRLTRKFYTGISYQSITASYRVHQTNTYIRGGDRFWGYNQLRTFFNYYPVKNLMMFAEIGHTAFRKFEAYRWHKTRVTDPLFTASKDSWFVNVGVAIRVRL